MSFSGTRATGSSSGLFEGHTGLLSRVSFLPDGKRFVSGSFDKTIRIWDLTTGKEVQRFTAHRNEVTWFSVSNEGRQLLSSDYNAHELRLWDLNTRDEIDQIDLGRLSPTRGSISKDNHWAVWPATDGTLIVYELSGEPEKAVAGAAKPVSTKGSGAKPPGAAR